MRSSLFACLVASACAAACGGSGTSLKARVADAHLAPVPMKQRVGLADAYRAEYLAEWQLRYTQGQLADVTSQMKIARNDIKQAQLSVKTAKIRLERATEVADQNRVAAAKAEQTIALLETEHARARLSESEQKQVFLRERVAAEKAAQLAAQANTERIKAQSMVSAGVLPSGFDVQRYRHQHKERQAAAKRASTRATAARQKLTALANNAKKARLAVQQARTASSQKAATAQSSPADSEPGLRAPVASSLPPVPKPSTAPPPSAPDKPSVEPPAANIPSPAPQETPEPEPTPPQAAEATGDSPVDPQPPGEATPPAADSGQEGSR